MSSESATCPVRLADARAAVYALLAHGFRYPDDELVRLLGDDRLWRGWPLILSETHAGSGASVAAVRRAFRATGAESSPGLSAMQAAYDALFGHAVSGKSPPYETEYIRSEINQRASQLADLAGFYRAFGLESVGQVHDRPDFISVECEFMSALCAKESYGREQGVDELIERCRDAQRAFLNDHLGRWLPAFANRVREAANHDFYGALAELADRFIDHECDRLGISPGPRWMELRPSDAGSETSVSCLDSPDCGPGAGPQFTPLHIDVRRS